MKVDQIWLSFSNHFIIKTRKYMTKPINFCRFKPIIRWKAAKWRIKDRKKKKIVKVCKSHRSPRNLRTWEFHQKIWTICNWYNKTTQNNLLINRMLSIWGYHKRETMCPILWLIALIHTQQNKVDKSMTQEPLTLDSSVKHKVRRWKTLVAHVIWTAGRRQSHNYDFSDLIKKTQLMSLRFVFLSKRQVNESKFKMQ